VGIWQSALLLVGQRPQWVFSLFASTPSPHSQQRCYTSLKLGPLAAAIIPYPTGRFFRATLFPGTSCQAKIDVVPKRRACRHFPTVSSSGAPSRGEFSAYFQPGISSIDFFGNFSRPIRENNYVQTTSLRNNAETICQQNQ
jgi:hypothetical protein